MPAKFLDDDPDPSLKHHQRKRRRIREKGKSANQTELNWCARYDAKVDGAALPPPPAPRPPPAAENASTSTPLPGDELRLPAHVTSQRVPEVQAAPVSAGKPMPVPALAPSVTIGPPPPSRSAAAPQAAVKPGTVGAPSEPLLPTASAEVQAARRAALDMIFGQVAVGLTELHDKVETTMQQPWVFPRAFWKEAWLPMCTDLFNRYLPDWMSGPIVEGVAVALPPVGLIRGARALEAAGYKLGEPGQPGRGRALSGQAAPKASASPATPPKDEPAPATAPTPQAPTAEGEKGSRVVPTRSGGDSTANPPAKPKAGPFDPRAAFGGGNGSSGKN
jgi:hypothetical protein